MHGSSAFHPLFTQPRKAEGVGGLSADSEAVTVPTLSSGFYLIFFIASKAIFFDYTFLHIHTNACTHRHTGIYVCTYLKEQQHTYTCMLISIGTEAVHTHTHTQSQTS